MIHFYADTLPTLERQPLQLFILEVIYVLSEGPKPRTKATKHEGFDFLKSAGGCGLTYLNSLQFSDILFFFDHFFNLIRISFQNIFLLLKKSHIVNYQILPILGNFNLALLRIEILDIFLRCVVVFDTADWCVSRFDNQIQIK